MAKKNKKNPNLYTALVYSYVDPVTQIGFNYSPCKWYQEGRIVASTNTYVIAYVDGFRKKYGIKVYRFQNVKRSGLSRLITHLESNPEKYNGWLHHINLYHQGTRQLVRAQILL
jgi:hypothetical protein